MGDKLEPQQNNEQVVAEPEWAESDHGVELEPDHEPEADPVPEPKVELKLEVEPDHEPEADPVLESEVEPVAADSCKDIDIEPLSGKPYFPIVIVKSHVGLVAYKYQLILPIKFSQALPNKTIPVILTRGGNSWETAYLGDKTPSNKRFDSRWRAFAEDNNLKVGDVCVFELVEQSDTLLKFKVQVLRGDFPSMLLYKEDGTINNPIVVE
ncbi:B3 domain-containing protein Os06g0112300-like [Chenopodium quinoa]|uniref:B3 domain-containing protein Os06g0112300-like n=1 Tax=Chenopodium quinoa TaxID=63459 RepID=UPI000B77FC86|nr:B3 domain-containing protein Os06g0112300-like [Chenopodium quinoa]